VRKTTILIEGGHRRLQDMRYINFFFNVFTVFFSKSKKSWLLRFLPCFVSLRFLELWLPDVRFIRLKCNKFDFGSPRPRFLVPKDYQ